MVLTFGGVRLAGRPHVVELSKLSKPAAGVESSRLLRRSFEALLGR